MLTVICVVVLGGLGLLFGLVLGFAAKKFAVEVDPREEAIVGCLPGANCGGCGFAGCGGYAAAVVKGEAPTNRCVAGGAAVAAQVAEIMGVSAESAVRSVAFVRCSGSAGKAQKKYDYAGIQDCRSAALLPGGGPKACAFGCLGLGSCVAACNFDAMHIVDGIAQVDRDKCVGCMACAQACPKHLIVKVPYDAQVNVPCASTEKGAGVRKICDVGCIGCKICEKTCEQDAIHVVDNVAVIDYDKCISCGKCAEKCPRHLIQDRRVSPAPAADSQTA